MTIRVRLSLDWPANLTPDPLRVALFGWLFARHHKGVLILNIRGRKPGTPPPDAHQRIFEQLHWLGLDWDRAPSVDDNPSSQRTVIDDHEMRVTHVFQDEKHLETTPRYLQLCRELGWTPPQFVSLPPIDGEPGVSLESYRARGYLALAIVNHLARLGWSPKGKRRVLSLAELATRFELSRLSRRSPPFDPERLAWFNHRCIRQLDVETLTPLLIPYWRASYGIDHRAVGADLTPTAWRYTLAAALADELRDLAQASDLARPFFTDQIAPQPDAAGALAQPYAPDILRAFIDGLPALDPFAFDKIDKFITALRCQFKAAYRIRSRDVMFVIRAALTGQLGGPCLVIACQLIGRARCIERAQKALTG